MIEYPTNLLTTNLIIHLLTHSLTHSLLLVQQPLSVNLPSYQLTLSTHPINTPYQFTHTASPLTPPLNSHPLPLTPPSSQQPSPSPPTPDPPLLTPPPSSYPPLLSTAIPLTPDPPPLTPPPPFPWPPPSSQQPPVYPRISRRASVFVWSPTWRPPRKDSTSWRSGTADCARAWRKCIERRLGKVAPYLPTVENYRCIICTHVINTRSTHLSTHSINSLCLLSTHAICYQLIL